MAVERITQNPHLEIIPNHTGPHYDELQTILVNTGITNEQAVEALNASWTHSHEERILAWDQQVIQDEAALQEELQLAQELEDQQRAQRELEIENEQKENEKKKPKMIDFDENSMVNDWTTTFSIRPRPPCRIRVHGIMVFHPRRMHRRNAPTNAERRLIWSL